MYHFTICELLYAWASYYPVFVPPNAVGRKSFIRLNARDGESISVPNAAIGADTTESPKNAVSVSMPTTMIMHTHTHRVDCTMTKLTTCVIVV